MRNWWVFIAVVLVVSVVAVCVEMVVMAVWGNSQLDICRGGATGDYPPWPGGDNGGWPLEPKQKFLLNGSFFEGAGYVAAEYPPLHFASPDHEYSLFVIQVGWPLRSGAYEHQAEEHYLGQGRTSRTINEPPSLWRHGLPIRDKSVWPGGSRHPEYFRRIPVRPIWPGFAVNVLLNACVIGPLMLVPGWIVRARRRRRGACPACGYAMAGLAAESRCPECGKATWAKQGGR